MTTKNLAWPLDRNGQEITPENLKTELITQKSYLERPNEHQPIDNWTNVAGPKVGLITNYTLVGPGVNITVTDSDVCTTTPWYGTITNSASAASPLARYDMDGNFIIYGDNGADAILHIPCNGQLTAGAFWTAVKKQLVREDNEGANAAGFEKSEPSIIPTIKRTTENFIFPHPSQKKGPLVKTLPGGEELGYIPNDKQENETTMNFVEALEYYKNKIMKSTSLPKNIIKYEQQEKLLDDAISIYHCVRLPEKDPVGDYDRAMKFIK